MILAGEVQVNRKRAEKSGMQVTSDTPVEVPNRRQRYVSRGGIKLAGALEDFSIDPAGRVCLDIGSSHGGFTDCLLQHGAARVYAVDVNVEQLDWKLRQDPRVIRIARNAREMQRADIAESADLVVIDVSFISVCKILGPAVSLAKPRAEFVILVKPQFESPREKVGAGGIVLDERLHQAAIAAVQRHAEWLGLECLGAKPSHLAGAEGNQEYFLHARKKLLE